VMGADYTFKNGIYINGQYLHGFIHERGNENLEHYLLGGIEKNFLGDKLKMTIAGGVEIKDFTEIEDNYAYIFSPEIAYQPLDNISMKIGGLFIDGKDGTTLSRVAENDEVYLKVNYSF